MNIAALLPALLAGKPIDLPKIPCAVCQLGAHYAELDRAAMPELAAERPEWFPQPVVRDVVTIAHGTLVCTPHISARDIHRHAERHAGRYDRAQAQVDAIRDGDWPVNG